MVLVSSEPQLSFKWLIQEINSFLRGHSFRRVGQQFGRQTADCWHVIAVQKSRSSASGEVRFTLNIAIQSKRVMAFRNDDASKMPRHWMCPVDERIGTLMGCGDKWWTIKDEDSARQAGVAICEALGTTVLPFVNLLGTDQAILSAYDSGALKGSGAPIDAREVELILLAAMGMLERASSQVKHYEIDFRSGPASRRACEFLERFERAYPGLR